MSDPNQQPRGSAACGALPLYAPDGGATPVGSALVYRPVETTPTGFVIDVAGHLGSRPWAW